MSGKIEIEKISQIYLNKMSKKTKVGVIQLKITKNKEFNLNNSISKIKEAARKGAKIICMPELFLTEYFCKVENHSYFKIAEKVPGSTSDIFCKLAKELNVILIISLFEKKLSGIYYNTCVTINNNGKIISKYRKMHIPDDPGYYEKFYFTPGDLGFKNVKTKFGDIGTLICWDQWFPEAARLTALKGSEIIFYPTAIGWHPKEKKKYGKNLIKVLSIKPGITGLWQVSGRNNLTYKTRVKLDLNYAKNYNFLMDIRILIRTIGVILFPLDRGAY